MSNKERRPSEVITSLRWRLEQEKSENNRLVANNNNKSYSKGGILKKSAPHTQYCPSGHVLTTHHLLLERRRYLQKIQGIDVLPLVGCDACSKDIEDDEYIGATCASCDIDFCEKCWHEHVESGKSIEELLAEARENAMNHHQQHHSSASVEGSLRSFNSTQEFCGSGHELVELSTIVRQRYLQDRDALTVLPIIECDCCSKQITEDVIAGCCLPCDLDFCSSCFKNGQSYEDVLEDRRGNLTDDDIKARNEVLKESGGQRYSGRRPTYKGTGRVNYDDYPDPTVFQWTFTGSSKSKAVEYFEKDFGNQHGLVKLDFFYTRGTVRTILVHPIKGERLLFWKAADRISPQSYRKILKDPRSHNNRRYKKQQKPKLVV